MRRPSVPAPLLAAEMLAAGMLAALALSGCAGAPEGTRGTGMVVTADGRFLANTDANERAETVRHITEDLDQAIAPTWKSTVTIDELPVWRASNVQEGDGVWQWRTATARIVLTGPGAPPVPAEELRAGVVAYLAKKAGTASATIAVRDSAPAAPVVPVAVAATATTTAAHAPATTARAYTVQAGDTLADIATLFYGSAAPWRRIVEANPGLDPAKLAPGQELVIPPAP